MFFDCIAETGIRFRKYKTSLLPESHSLNSTINSTLIWMGQVCAQVCVWGCLVNWWLPCRADSNHNFLLPPRITLTFISQFFEGDSKWMALNLGCLSLSMILSAILMRGLLLNGCRTTGKNCLWLNKNFIWIHLPSLLGGSSINEFSGVLCCPFQEKVVFVWCCVCSGRVWWAALYEGKTETWSAKSVTAVVPQFGHL